jgi:hypothetical protein
MPDSGSIASDDYRYCWRKLEPLNNPIKKCGVARTARDFVGVELQFCALHF